MTIKERISDLVDLGWSYGKIAKEAGVSKATISRWHGGVTKPNKNLEKMAQRNLNLDAQADAFEYFLKQQPIIMRTNNMKKSCGPIEDVGNCTLDEHIAYYEKQLKKLKAQKEAEKWKFTEDEKVILRNVDKQYKWLGRDTEGTLWFYDTKPTYTIGYGNAKYTDLFNHLFRCIKIQEEPCEFRKFI